MSVAGGKERPHAFRRALVVEPNKNMRSLTAGMLKTMGFDDVTVCATPIEALSLIASHRIDIVFAGATHGTGLALLLMLRHGSDSPNRKVTYTTLSSGADHQEAVSARDSGVDGLLAIPFSAAMLARRLLALSRNRPAFIEASTYVGPDRRRMLALISHDDRRRGPPLEAPHHIRTCAELLRRYIEQERQRRAAQAARLGIDPVQSAKKPIAKRAPTEREPDKMLRGTVRDLKPGHRLLRPVLSQQGVTLVEANRALDDDLILRIRDLVKVGETENHFVIALSAA